MRYPSLIASNIIKESELDGRGTRGGGRGRGSLRAIGSILLYLLSATFSPRVSLSLVALSASLDSPV